MGQYYFNASNYEEVPDGADADGADADGSGDDADSAGSAGSEAELFCGMAKNGKWTLAIRTSDSESRMKALECFDWREMLQNIKTGDESMILAIDQNSGSILSAPDSTLFGQPAEALKLRLEDAEGPASLDDLKAAIGKKDDIVRVESGGRDCYAIRLNVDDVLMLMIAPVEGHGDILENVVIMRALFLMLITGICALYACFQIKGAKGNSVRRFKRFAWDRRLSGRLTACAALVCTVALVFGLFMEAVFTRAEAYDYNRDKSIGAAMLYFDNQDSAGRLQRWFDEEYLTRCRIARAILKHIPAEKKNRAYIAALAEKLSVKYIYVFDGDGAIVAANSPYDRITVGRGDPFYKLLEGCPQMTGEITFPGAPGETLRRVGITMHDESQDGEGLIMIVMDEIELKEIEDNLGLGNVFEQLCLADGTWLIVVNEKDRTIVTNAEVIDGKYAASMNAINMAGLSCAEVGLGEDILQHNYIGILSFMGRSYSILVDRMDEKFFLLGTADFHLDAVNVACVALGCAAVLLYMALVMVVACPMRADAHLTEAAGEASEEAPARKKKLSLFGAHNTTPFFEERWPREATPWQEKTPNQQFSVVLKLILFAAFAAILVNAWIVRENSVWYFILGGQWREGINLHSITACLIYVCLLLMLKAVIHKLLYIVARSTDPRGETLCQLLDSALGYILAIVGVFICLGKLGVNTAALSLTAGVAGVIFSIGCQSIVADILAGFLMTFEGTVHVGDFLFFNDKPEFILSIGIRTTRLKFFGDVLVVRNNEFKDYVLRDGNKQNRTMVNLSIDFSESLERVEGILTQELPKIHETLCGLSSDPVSGPNYIGVTNISDYGVQLSFTVFCMGKDVYALTLALNRELKLMCERNGIVIAHHMYTNSPVKVLKIESK